MAETAEKLEKLWAKADKTPLPGSTWDALAAYFELLASWTGGVDLVADGTPEKLFSIHGIDALAAHRVIFKNLTGGSVLDVGSGAGLPGMVWAIVDPAREYHLCEPREKRIVFLKECRRRLRLKNVTVHHGRLEELSPEKRFQVISFRALRPEGELLLEAEERLAPGGAIAWLAGAESADGFEAHPYQVPGDTKGRRILLRRVSE